MSYNNTTNYNDTTSPKALVAMTLILALLAIVATNRALAEGQECRRNNLEPSKLGSALWNDDGKRIYLTDAIGKAVRKVSLLSGGSIKIDLNPENIDLEATIAAKRSDDGFLQLVTRGAPKTLHWLDADLKRRGSTELALPNRADMRLVKSAVSWSNRVLVLNSVNWVPIGDRIFAYGFLGNPKSPNGSTASFFVHQVRSPGSHNVIPRADMVMEFPHYEYYLLNMPYMVAIGDTVYFMTMHKSPELYAFDVRNPRNGATRIRVDDIPVFIQPIPPIDNRALLRQIDNEAIPAGIYSDGGAFLYVLHRRPVGRRKTINWKLYKLAVEPVTATARSLGAVTLPIRTKARHLTLLRLPEESMWAAFEIAGAALEASEKHGDLISMARIPESWLDPENEASPLLAAAVRPDVCRLMNDE